MRSNYKPIGKYVQQVNSRNKDLAVTNLKGININKEFMPSVANTHGTDLSKYKVVKRNQFAFNPMHVGRDEVLPIGMLSADEPVIVSPAYAVFEVLDEEELMPEYLMMWCRRSEFDRNAWFTTDNSVRGGFSWNDFCEMTLPVPHINKQREIVREYNTIVDRIKLNEQINQKLEETAQALYKQWFVDFEFPISKEYAESIGKPELEGKPYKSSGGEMVFANDLDAEIPHIWEECRYTDLIGLYGGGTPKTEVKEYWDGEIGFFTPKDVGDSYYTTSTIKNISISGLRNSSTKEYQKGTVFITARGTIGAVSIAGLDMAMNQSCYAAIGKNNIDQIFVHQHTLDAIKRLKNEAIGGVFGALVTRDFDGQTIIKPDSSAIENFSKRAEPIYRTIFNGHKQKNAMVSSRELLLGRIASNRDT